MRPAAVLALLALLAILAFLGLFSGTSFLTDPSGGSHGLSVSILEGTPIDDFTLVGLFFVIAYGALPLLAIYGLLKLPRWHWTDPVNRWTGQNWSWSLTIMVGIILIVWIAMEVAYIGSPQGIPRSLQIIMASLGAVLIALAMLPGVRRYAKLAE